MLPDRHFAKRFSVPLFYFEWLLALGWPMAVDKAVAANRLQTGSWDRRKFTVKFFGCTDYQMILRHWIFSDDFLTAYIKIHATVSKIPRWQILPLCWFPTTKRLSASVNLRPEPHDQRLCLWTLLGALIPYEKWKKWKWKISPQARAFRAPHISSQVLNSFQRSSDSKDAF